MGKEKKKKSKAEQQIEEEQIERVMKRLASEEIVKERVKIEAVLVSAPPEQPGVNVKIKLHVLDQSFYAKRADVLYNAGTEKFESIQMDKVDMDNFAVILGNVPKEIQILYYIKILDKSGEWQQFPRPELINTDATDEEEPYFSFSVEPNGTISFKKLWDDSGLNKCPVCGYMCAPQWDTCPECRSPLFDTTQEVFQDAQKEKIAKREAMKNADLEWEDASDESWRGLPECPNCGYTVQLEWETCPVCQLDLTTVEIQKKESYEELMTEEEKEAAAQASEIRKRKQKIKGKLKDAKEAGPEEPEWENEDGIDIL